MQRFFLPFTSSDKWTDGSGEWSPNFMFITSIVSRLTWPARARQPRASRSKIGGSEKATFERKSFLFQSITNSYKIQIKSTNKPQLLFILDSYIYKYICIYTPLWFFFYLPLFCQQRAIKHVHFVCSDSKLRMYACTCIFLKPDILRLH